jgi:hypothetical protein
MMHGHEKSSSAIVAVKPTNKAERSAAEPVEPRAEAEGNAGQQSTHRAQYRVRVAQALVRIRQAIAVVTRGGNRMRESCKYGSVPDRDRSCRAAGLVGNGLAIDDRAPAGECRADRLWTLCTIAIELPGGWALSGEAMTDEELPRFRYGLPDIYDGAPWSETAIEDLKNHVAHGATLEETASVPVSRRHSVGGGC